MTNTLPIKAQVMIGMVAVASLCALSFGVVRWQTQVWPQLVLLLAAAALSSRLKVKIPEMTSSMSGNLPVILLGVSQLGLFGSLLVALQRRSRNPTHPARIKRKQYSLYLTHAL
jgi:hypothetical protein